jgi:hypothetical protein
MQSTITLPVSIGEALDKYSILAIKLKYIQDPKRRADILNEYEALTASVAPYCAQCRRLYELLVQSNERLWLLVEETRANHGICDERVLYENDARFRLKRKINDVVDSQFKEQKSFKTQPLEIHLIINITREVAGLLEELSIYYDALRCYGSTIEVPLLFNDPDIHFKFVVRAFKAPEGAVVIHTEEDLEALLDSHRKPKVKPRPQ